MTGMSVLTLAHGRHAHLRNLVEGLRRSDLAPAELVVVDMNDEPLALEPAPFPIRLVRLPQARLPLAAARNLAARSSASENLLFLDADCIPSQTLISVMAETLARNDGLICPLVLYLGPEDARQDGWTDFDLRAKGQAHAARDFPPAGTRVETNPGLFWSLAFGVRRKTFEALGGFDEDFVGYGGEDTDLGFRAAEADIPLIFTGDACAFHQHHPVSDPPLEHLSDIVRNAQLFRRKWGRWPMEGWLSDFEKIGAIEVGGENIKVF